MAVGERCWDREGFDYRDEWRNQRLKGNSRKRGSSLYQLLKAAKRLDIITTHNLHKVPWGLALHRAPLPSPLPSSLGSLLPFLPCPPPPSFPNSPLPSYIYNPQHLAIQQSAPPTRPANGQVVKSRALPRGGPGGFERQGPYSTPLVSDLLLLKMSEGEVVISQPPVTCPRVRLPPFADPPIAGPARGTVFDAEVIPLRGFRSRSPYHLGVVSWPVSLRPSNAVRRTVRRTVDSEVKSLKGFS